MNEAEDSDLFEAHDLAQFFLIIGAYVIWS
jgi:hypothetical protein